MFLRLLLLLNLKGNVENQKQIFEVIFSYITYVLFLLWLSNNILIVCYPVNICQN